jgi:DnaK suppressor protein
MVTPLKFISPAEQVDYSHFYQLLMTLQDEVLTRNDIDRLHLQEQQAMSSDPGDAPDSSVSDTSADYFLQLADRERHVVLEIRRSLNKIHQGEYGYCEECEELIPRERLEKIPYARYCVRCQAFREARKRMNYPNLYPKL